MATLALLLWPLIGIVLFVMLGPSRGLIWTVAAGYLLLPENFAFNVVGLPPYDKTMALALSALLGLLVARGRKELPALRPGQVKLERVLFTTLILVFLATPILTVLTNGERIVFTQAVIPGLGFRDLVSMTANNAAFLAIVLISVRLLSDEEMHRHLLLVIVLCAIAYSFLVLFERRMSPQLNQWIYGYFQHSWAQHIRGGGFRPIVFLRHGLWVGFFLFSAVMAAFILLKRDKIERPRLHFLLAGCWLLLVLFLSRNLGAFALSLVFVPALLFLGRRLQVGIAICVAIFFFTLPIARQANILPLEAMVSVTERISFDRARSFEYRLENEDAYLERALEKPLAGWGIWGRWRVYDEAGQDISTSDGKWVSMLGERGWLGYLSFFGLLTFPVMLLGRAHRRSPLSTATAGIALIMAGNLIYLIPNSAFNPIGWMMVGALMGFILYEPANVEKLDPTAPPPDRDRRNQYTRFPKTARA